MRPGRGGYNPLLVGQGYKEMGGAPVVLLAVRVPVPVLPCLLFRVQLIVERRARSRFAEGNGRRSSAGGLGAALLWMKTFR